MNARYRNISTATLLAATIICASTGATAQQPVLGSHPHWLTRWSPAQRNALTRATLHALLYPMAPIGLAFTTGNPAGIVLQVDSAANWLRIGTGEESGVYREELEPGSVRETAASGTGWTPVGDRSVLAGNVSIARRSLGAPVFSGLSSTLRSPLLVVDTSGAGIDEAHARIDGAAALSFGKLAAGIAAGYDVLTRNTRASPVPHIGRVAAPAASSGLTWSVSDDLAFGAHARWRRHNERLSMYAIANATQLYLFDGYRDPLAQDFRSLFLRVVRADETAVGAGAAGSIGAGRWALYAELSSMTEKHRSDDNPDGAADRWAGDALRAGAALRAPLFGASVLPGVSIEWTSSKHDLARGEVPAVTFLAEEDRVDIRGELRGTGTGAFEWIVAIDVAGLDQTATDSLAGTVIDLRSWSRSLTLAGRREFGRFSVAFGGAYGQYLPAGSIPRPGDIGPGYALYLAPRFGLLATDANRWSFASAVSYRWGGRSWTLEFSRSSVEPVGLARLQGAPDGNRSVWRVELVTARYQASASDRY